MCGAVCYGGEFAALKFTRGCVYLRYVYTAGCVHLGGREVAVIGEPLRSRSHHDVGVPGVAQAGTIGAARCRGEAHNTAAGGAVVVHDTAIRPRRTVVCFVHNKEVEPVFIQSIYQRGHAADLNGQVGLWAAATANNTVGQRSQCGGCLRYQFLAVHDNTDALIPRRGLLRDVRERDGLAGTRRRHHQRLRVPVAQHRAQVGYYLLLVWPERGH